LKIIMIVILLIILGLLFVAAESARELHALKVKKYELHSNLISKDKKYRFIFFSDYHETLHGKMNKKIIEAIHDLNPDLVLVGGDMICGAADPDDVVPAVSLLNELGKDFTVLLGLGNHEEKSRAGRYGSTQNWSNLYKGLCEGTLKERKDRYCQKSEDIETGIYLLDNSTFSFDDEIEISGLTIETRYYKRLEKTVMESAFISGKLGDSSKNKYCILLAHDPYFFDAYRKWGADLSLSGHNHGGMVRLPWLGGVISPRLFLFPKYDYGLFCEKEQKMIITSGLGQHSIPVRLFNYPELVLVEVSGN